MKHGSYFPQLKFKIKISQRKIEKCQLLSLFHNFYLHFIYFVHIQIKIFVLIKIHSFKIDKKKL